jgi:putative ABC transport system permease protein
MTNKGDDRKKAKMRSALLRKSLYIAVKALRRNGLQTALTMLGMSIGVATLLTTIALGAGAQASIESQVRAAGMNVIVVSSGNYKMPTQTTSDGETEEPAAFHPDAGRPRLRMLPWQPASQNRPVRPRSGLGHPILGDRRALFLHVLQRQENPIIGAENGPESLQGLGASEKLSLEDAAAIGKLRGVQHVSGGVAENGTVMVGNRTWFTKVRGEEASLTGIRRAWAFPYGGFFTKRELERGADVIVLGSVVSDKLFGAGNPVGEQVTLKGRVFRVKGVVGSGVWMIHAAPGDGQFDAVYLPVTTAMAAMQKKSLDTVTISTKSTGDVTQVSKAVTVLLRERHGLGSARADDFVVVSEAHKSLARGGMRTDVARAVVGNVSNLDKVTLDQLGKTLDRASKTMTALLGGIAVVSLVVGGIGIMNIMLLSVTERTKEIGIRRAVGALSEEVKLQFLMEALTLSLTGGLLGVVGGLVSAYFITRLVQWSTSISPVAVVVSFGISATIGMVFGYYPARQAARVSPMSSLRYE